MFQISKAKLAERLSARLGIEVNYATASALVDLAVAMGQGKEIGNEARPAKTKGKPSKVYELPDQFNIMLSTGDEVGSIVAPANSISFPLLVAPAVEAPAVEAAPAVEGLVAAATADAPAVETPA